MTAALALLWALQGITAVGSPVPGVELGVGGALGSAGGISHATVQLMAVGDMVEPVPVAWVRMEIDGRADTLPFVCVGSEWVEAEVRSAGARLARGATARIAGDCAWAARLHPTWEALRPYLETPLEVRTESGRLDRMAA